MKAKKIGDISAYKSKAVGVFTWRQFLFAAAGLLIGIAVFIVLDVFMITSVSLFISVLIFVVIFVLGLPLGGMHLTTAIANFFLLVIGGGNYKYETGGELYESEIKNRKADKE